MTQSRLGLFANFHRAIRFALPQRDAILFILVLTLLMAAANAAEPLALKYVIDNLSLNPKVDLLVKGLIVLAALALSREAAHAVSDWLIWRTRIGLQYALLEATIGKLHQMPLRLQRSQGVGAIMTKLDRSIQGFVTAVTQLLFNVLPSVLFLLIAMTIMFRLEYRLALLVLLFAPMPALIAVRAAPEQVRRERALLERWARIYSRFNEVLSGILIVRSFAMEEAEKRRFLGEVQLANREVIQGVATDAGYGATGNLVIAIARLSAIAAGGYLAVNHEVTVGTIIAFLGYVGGLFGPIQGLSGIYQTLSKASVSLEEIFGVIDIQEYLGDSPGAQDVGTIRGDVSFDKVHFRYEQSGRPLLEGIDLHVNAGETIAVVGPSGSGKTTLMALLMRFYDPLEGVIRLDGRDLRTLKQSSLRRNIGVVLQDPLLFNDTIRANIAYARPEASLAEVIAAAGTANIHPLIERLADGYETMVGERGALLSAGERQRVTIARAILKDPRILILDEATSSLDAESEAAVQSALERLMQGRTTFIIAHRLVTVANADRIVVLRAGRIAEMGSHVQLLEHDGYYASLVRRQSHGLIPNDAVEHPRRRSTDVAATSPIG
ncbi:MAG: ABC transporter ATP-binding protein [Steroidobacteraceae bacterium]